VRTDLQLTPHPRQSASAPPTGIPVREYWSAGKALYEPENITVPVLLLHAEWDLDVTLNQMVNLFPRFRNAPYRRWTEIGEGTHMVVMEQNRWQILESIKAFLARS